MIQVHEYARLTIDERATPSLDCTVIKRETLEWVPKLASEWKGEEPLLLFDGYHMLKLGNYIGYSQGPDGEGIEILPKTNLGQDNPQQTRKILQRMLLTALNIRPRVVRPAELMRMNVPLHEWIFRQFLSELQVLVIRGLCFGYRRVDEESRFIRGQLKIQRQQRQSPARQHLFHVSRDICSPNRLENRLLKTALNYVLATCQNSENQRLANKLSHRMAEIPLQAKPQRELHFWNNNKLMQIYNDVRLWCESILEKMNPNFQQDSHKGILLLFPMEQLSEKYVKVSLRPRICRGYQLLSQASSQYLLEHTVGNSDKPQAIFLLKPDPLLRGSNGAQTPDMRWKLIEQISRQTDKKYNITQSDPYQMFAYGHKYQDGKGHMMLIYPKHLSFNRPLPAFHYSNTLTVWAVPFCLDNQQLVPGNWQEYSPNLYRQGLLTGATQIYRKAGEIYHGQFGNGLISQILKIISAIRDVVPLTKKQREETRVKAEARRIQRELDEKRYREKELIRGEKDAYNASLAELKAIMMQWTEDKLMGQLFHGAALDVSMLGVEQKELVMERLRLARQSLLVEPTVERLLRWEIPLE